MREGVSINARVTVAVLAVPDSELTVVVPRQLKRLHYLAFLWKTLC